MRSNRYLLDTCALIWLVQKSDRLSASVRQSLVQAADIFISPVTAWEIAVKCQSGKMKLPLDPGEWFRIAVESFNLTIFPLDYMTLVKSAQLPPHHRDPADRAIIASALGNGLPVVTGDDRFAAYGVPVVC